MVADCVAATVKIPSRNSYWRRKANQKGPQELMLRHSVKVSRRFKDPISFLRFK